MTLRVNVLRIALAIVLSPVNCIGNSQPPKGGADYLERSANAKRCFLQHNAIIGRDDVHIVSTDICNL